MVYQPEAEMKVYYRDRAPDYDLVYSYPERQDDLRYLENYIPGLFSNLDVIDVAAGTGYWSQFIISQANSVLATDITQEALNQVKARQTKKPIDIKVIDAFSLDEIDQRFTGAFAGLWISHIPRQKLNDFLASLHSCLQSGSPVVFLDNSLSQCNRLPLSYTDRNGNTYQDRKLDSDSVYRVLKNFPSEAELRSVTRDYGSAHKYLEMENYWLFQYVAN
ncbi:MAG: class I SAM-dependent methyltransferase [Candidatus Sedimenticola sp. 20ELBAFRAG]